MKLTQKVSFPGVHQFEQYTAEFTIEESDIPAEMFNGANLLEKMFVFNALVAIEGLLFQYAKGFISREDYEQQRKRLYGLLAPKLQKMVLEILKAGGGVNGSGTDKNGTKSVEANSGK
jgi:hypothetical protein